jgi:hypothetical protein
LDGWFLKGYDAFFNFIIKINFTMSPTLHYSIIPIFQLGRSPDFEINYFVYESKSRKNITKISF